MATESNDYLTIGQATKCFPSIEGRAVHTSAVWRWARKGIVAKNGERIRLEHIRLGRRVLVPSSAIPKFLNEVAAADAKYFDSELVYSHASAPTDDVGKRTPGPRVREEAIKMAEAVCEQEGI